MSLSESESPSVVFNSLQPHGLWRSPWNSLGLNTRVGSHALLQAWDLPNPGIEPSSPTLQADSLPAEAQSLGGSSVRRKEVRKRMLLVMNQSSLCEQAPGITLPRLGSDKLLRGPRHSSNNRIRMSSKDHLKSKILIDLKGIIFLVKENLYHKYHLANRNYNIKTGTLFCSNINKEPSAAAAAKSLQLCLTLWDPIDGSPPSSLIPGTLQARTLEWAAISFSIGSSQPRGQTSLSCIGRQILYH